MNESFGCLKIEVFSDVASMVGRRVCTGLILLPFGTKWRISRSSEMYIFLRRELFTFEVKMYLRAPRIASCVVSLRQKKKKKEKSTGSGAPASSELRTLS